ncbi:coenzyme PQQ synthesis protein D (PqqD) [Haloactinospora alba]|uniref:Coenzyme PQQ synthesis protein D (PqqD) n=1 Tax=Haloactinospora alba TaxID=405555 RepID=A0A543NM69_9ACTN|nr:PqqD family protein [Haloactinospora alba]TQN32913.1 coenzyme PQQ synthesis protein D (PqqD) [Haloactinospora alba]
MDDSLRPHRNVYTTFTSQGTMLLDTRGRGRWFALTPTGGCFWYLLSQGALPSEASRRIARRYGVDPRRVREDMEALTEQLRQHGLVSSPQERRWRPW